MSQLLNRLPGAIALCLLTAALFYAGGAFAAPAEPVAAAAGAVAETAEAATTEAAAAVEAAAVPEEEAAPASTLLAHQAPLELNEASTSWT